MHGHNLRVTENRTLPFFWISRVLLAKFELSWRAILAYTALAYFAHSADGKVKNIAVKTLAVRVGVSEDTIQRGLAELVKKRAILKRERRSKNKKTGKHVQLPNEYILINLAGSDDEKDPL